MDKIRVDLYSCYNLHSFTQSGFRWAYLLLTIHNPHLTTLFDGSHKSLYNEYKYKKGLPASSWV